MKEIFRTAPELAVALADAGIGSAADVLGLAGGEIGTSFRGEVAHPVADTCGRFFLKAYCYASWRKSRGLVGRGTLWGRAPELQEFHALTWLRDRGVPAVRPVAAASLRHRGRLVAHVLLTEWMARSPNLASVVADPAHPALASRSDAYALAEMLGRELARMHLHGFAHRDCHARNILVRLERGRPRIWFLDCRRGGATKRRRAQLRDLACLRLDLRGGEQSRFSASAWTHLLQTYLGSGARAGVLDGELEKLADREQKRQQARASRRAARQPAS